MIKKLLILSLFLTSNYLLAQSSWELLNPKPTILDGEGITFSSDTNGYILNNEELLHTDDGGETWNIKQNIDSGNDIAIKNTTGYIVGDYGYVLKTTDGGVNWSKININSGQNLGKVYIVDDNTVVISGERYLYKTLNNGNTWESYSVNPDNYNSIQDLFFIDSLTGYVVFRDGIVYKTIDGGTTWTESLAMDNYNSNAFIHFFNDLSGVVSNGNGIYKTTDGGTSWTLVNNSVYIESISFINESTGYGYDSNGMIYRTDDGGESWLFITEIESNIIPRDLYFFDEAHGFVIGRDGVIFETLDGGVNWKGYTFYNSISQLQFLTSTTAFVAAGKDIYTTIDSGDTWQYQSSLEQEVINFKFLSETTGYLITTNFVYKSIDGGMSWIKKDNGITTNFLDDLFSVDFIDENIGIISGGASENNKVVYKTTDGGETWNKQESISFKQIEFINSETVYALEDSNYSNNRLFKSTDGGTTWNAIYEGESTISSFDFVDANTGYFKSGYSDLYKTIDGGENWNLIDDNNYYSSGGKIKFYNNNVGYSYSSGEVNKTENGGYSWENIYNNYNYYSEKIILSLFEDTMFIGENKGQIRKTSIDYNSVKVTLLDRHDYIDKEPVVMKGNVTSNTDEITDIKFLYGKEYSVLDNEIPASTTTVEALQTETVNAELEGLEANTYYYYQLVGTSNGVQYKSDIRTFFTPNEYEIYIGNSYVNDNTSLELTAEITSFNKKLTAIEFVYGTKSDSLIYSVPADLSTVDLGQQQVKAKLTELTPNTTYFVKVKALRDGIEIFSYNTREIKTKPDYIFELNAYYYNDDSATLQSSVYAYKEDLKEVTFEYGTTLDMTNSIAATPSEIPLNEEFSSDWVYSEISELDKNQTYFYRLKALQGEEYVYSEIKAFNYSGDLSVTEIESIENEDHSILLKAYIYPGSNYVSNVIFEYGLSSEYGNSITTISESFYYDGNMVEVTIPKSALSENTTYFYRLKFDINNEEYISNDKTFITNERYSVNEDNYKIEFTNETCVNKGNGSVKITPIIVQNYEAAINDEIYQFTNELFVEDMIPGKYLVCLKIVGSEESQQCFEIEIKAAEELTGDIANNKKTINKNSVSFYIEKGTSPFRVVSNGRTIGTYSSRSFEAIIEKEGLVEVYSSLPCEGKIEKYISNKTISIYPNPIINQTIITLPTRESKNKDIHIEVIDNSGKVIIGNTYPVLNNAVTIDMSILNPGMYFIKVYSDQVETLKVVKK